MTLESNVNPWDIMITNTHGPHSSAPKHMRQNLTELRAKTDHLITIIRDFRILLPIMNWATKLVRDKKTEYLNYTKIGRAHV